MPRLLSKIIWSALISGLCFSITAQENKIGDIGDGGRSVPVHLIQLFDEDSSVVRTDDQPMLPFSTKITCGKCHDYQVVRRGWHFTAGDSGVTAGRPGHPWIFADQASATQIPVSLHNWAGVMRPEDLGLTAIEYLQLFGRQIPGGSVGDNDRLRSLDNIFRWQVSGDMEINCLSCHDAEFTQDHAAHASNTAKQNFRWVAAASSGIANVYGSARDMPDNYDIYWGMAPDLAKITPPHVIYDLTRFNQKNEVHLDLVRDIPDRNCYFCHSTRVITPDRKEKWMSPEDVHLKAGLTCVDCHRNGLNHDMIRGYEDIAAEEGRLTGNIKSEFSCAGCHLHSGRLGAPKPEHAGIPPLHFDKMSCTTCHSGIYPEKEAPLVKTSQGHGLGVHGTNRSDTTLPHIITNVFVRNTDGMIRPHHVVWPSYWAFRDTSGIFPVPVKQIRDFTTPFIMNDDSTGNGNWLALPDSQIVKILDTLITIAKSDQQPVYISGGKLIVLNGDRTLNRAAHQAASPYYWAFGHDVRPASRSLGVDGCQDCHSGDSNFYYSAIHADSPVTRRHAENLENIDFMDLNRAGTYIFSMSFFFRPWLKVLIILCTLLMVIILFSYTMRAVRYITENLGK